MLSDHGADGRHRCEQPPFCGAQWLAALNEIVQTWLIFAIHTNIWYDVGYMSMAL